MQLTPATSAPPRFRMTARRSLVALALVAGGCAMQPVAPPVTPAIVAAARGTPEETLRLGRQLYAGPCTSCHRADPIGTHTVAEWKEILPDMAERAEFDASRRAAVTAYVLAVRTAPPEPTR